MNELSEKSEVLQHEKQQRKSWKMKVAALERQMEQLQVRQAPANLLPPGVRVGGKPRWCTVLSGSLR